MNWIILSFVEWVYALRCLSSFLIIRVVVKGEEGYEEFWGDYIG